MTAPLVGSPENVSLISAYPQPKNSVHDGRKYNSIQTKAKRGLALGAEFS
jgi:hypothetical protein